MDLIIVESPSKAKTISKYLGGKYMVDASGGHIRDLPEKRLGVNIDNNFEPSYTINPDKKQVIKRLIETAAKADKIYLATDPDREGEAISWHLQHVLKLKRDDKQRIEFNEISPQAVKKAIENPRIINYNLVDAQQARRILDRLVGYKLSPLLCKRISKGLSAGRVQSVALRLIVDREREITAFIPVEYWNLNAQLQDKSKSFVPFKALLSEKNGKKFKPSNAEEADIAENAVKNADFIVKKVKKSIALSHAPAPFTTSTLQQDASNKMSISSPDVMRLAQHLYEGIDTDKEGHIAFVTYIRTDSVRISTDAQDAAREYITQKYGKEYIPEKPNFYKSKKSAQDAHEAIRPIDINRTPESVKNLLDKSHYRLYKLIYERFLASQMSEAKYNSLQLDIEAADYVFKASGKTLLFKGFTVIYDEAKSNDDEEDGEGGLLPDLTVGDILDLINLTKEQKFTKPPARFTDASLVKAMEDKGIGRPSTYASIISVLAKRNYTVKEGKFMVPTKVAFEITDMLVKYFSDIVDVSFTSDMEDKLDGIEEGGDWHKVLADFYPPFAEKLVFASNDGDELTDIVCEKCGAFMIRRSGRYGKYLACSNNPACTNVKSESDEVSEEKCPKCGANLLIKNGKFGKFLGCPNYPECTYIRAFDSEPTDEKCPKCGGDMVIRKGKFGKYLNCLNCKANISLKKESVLAGICPVCKKPTKKTFSKSGKLFYGCTDYPNCKFMSWDMPTGELCPKCGHYLIEKNGKIRCSEKDCDYAADLPENENK